MLWWRLHSAQSGALHAALRGPSHAMRWWLHPKRRRFAAGTREGWCAGAFRFAAVDVRNQEAAEVPCAAAAALLLPDTVCSGLRAGPCSPMQRGRLSATPSHGCTWAAVGCSGSAGIWFFSWAHEPSFARQEREARTRDFRGRNPLGIARPQGARARRARFAHRVRPCECAWGVAGDFLARRLRVRKERECVRKEREMRPCECAGESMATSQSLSWGLDRRRGLRRACCGRALRAALRSPSQRRSLRGPAPASTLQARARRRACVLWAACGAKTRTPHILTLLRMSLITRSTKRERANPSA